MLCVIVSAACVNTYGLWMLIYSFKSSLNQVFTESIINTLLYFWAYLIQDSTTQHISMTPPCGIHIIYLGSKCSFPDDATAPATAGALIYLNAATVTMKTIEATMTIISIMTNGVCSNPNFFEGAIYFI